MTTCVCSNNFQYLLNSCWRPDLFRCILSHKMIIQLKLRNRALTLIKLSLVIYILWKLLYLRDISPFNSNYICKFHTFRILFFSIVKFNCTLFILLYRAYTWQKFLSWFNFRLFNRVNSILSFNNYIYLLHFFFP